MDTILGISKFILGSSVIASVIINWIKVYIKDVISPRWGDAGIQIFILCISAIIAGIGYSWELLPSTITSAVLGIFAGTTVIYTVIVKAIYRNIIKNEKEKK